MLLEPYLQEGNLSKIIAKKAEMKLPFPQTFLQPVIDLIIPERCRICGVHAAHTDSQPLCSECLAEVKYLGPAVCRYCGDPFRSTVAKGRVCSACIKKPPPWDQAMSVVEYSKVSGELLSRLKYQADTTMLPALEVILQKYHDHLTAPFDYIIPVPLHPARLRMRGMNQAVHLARLFFPENQGLIKSTILLRQRATKPQTGLDGYRRRRNLRGAFSITDNSLIVGKRLCVVDDVYTTGTTVAECSKVLKSAGASEIRVLTVARAVQGKTE